MGVQAFSPRFIVYFLTVATAIIAAACYPPTAGAQTAPKVKALFEKYDLIGTFAADCSMPADGRNAYHVYRALDDNYVQADQMSGPTTRDSAMLVDRAVETKPNELAIEGTVDQQRYKMVFQMDEGRRRLTEMSREPGDKVISGGRFTKGGAGSPWFHKCTQKITIQGSPEAGVKCIDVPNAVFRTGTQLQMWDCGNNPSQTFSLDESTGRVTIGGLCVEGGAGEPLRIAWCNGQPNQAWKADNTAGYVKLVGLNGNCVDISNYAKTNGAALTLWGCHGQWNQRWQIRPGFDLTYEENTNYDGKTIEEFGTPNADAKLCQSRCIENSQCAAWVYRKAEGRTNKQPYCWLRNTINDIQRGGSDDLTIAGRVRSDAR